MEKRKLLFELLKNIQHARMIMQLYIDKNMTDSMCNNNIRRIRFSYQILSYPIDLLVAYLIKDTIRADRNIYKDELIEHASEDLIACDYNDFGGNRNKIMEYINNAKCIIDSFDPSDDNYDECDIKYHVTNNLKLFVRWMRNEHYDNVDKRYTTSMTDAQLKLIKALNSMCFIKRLIDTCEYPTNYKDTEQIWDIHEYTNVLVPKWIDVIKSIIHDEIPDIDIDTTLYSIDADISNKLKIDIIGRHMSYTEDNLFTIDPNSRRYEIFSELKEEYKKIHKYEGEPSGYDIDDELIALREQIKNSGIYVFTRPAPPKKIAVSRSICTYDEWDCTYNEDKCK